MKSESDILLDKIAKSMGCKVVTWDTINETIKKEISFARIIDTSGYINNDEKIILDDKCFIGGKNEC